MAEVNANSLPAKTDLGTNDSAIVVDQTTNAGALVDLDVLADKVLDRITSKTFANQVGGSSAATLLAQLSTLNSNLPKATIEVLTSDHMKGAHVSYGRLHGIIITELSGLTANGYTDLGLNVPVANYGYSYDLRPVGSNDTYRVQILTAGSPVRVYNYTADTGVKNIVNVLWYISAA